MKAGTKNNRPSLFSTLKPYSGAVFLLTLFTILSSGLNLLLPKITASAIDDFGKGGFSIQTLFIKYSVLSILVFVFIYLQNMVQIYSSEKMAKEMRAKLIKKISEQNYMYVQNVTADKLLTTITSDVDAVKNFFGQAVNSIISSAFLIVGAGALMMMINWKLALAVFAVVPIISFSFYIVMVRVRKLFKKAQETIDWLNKVINESILGASLIRLLHSQKQERNKFTQANEESKNVGLKIVGYFSTLIPIINLVTCLATFGILLFGGHLVILGTMTLGGFSAFNSYLTILIFPIMIISFMGNVIAQADASFQRILDVLLFEKNEDKKGTATILKGNIVFKDVSISIDEKPILKNVSFSINNGTRTAIIGPTAAGKSQLIYLLIGLLRPTSGQVMFDGKSIDEYDRKSFCSQVGVVFQDSIIFNLSLKENIAFSSNVSERDMDKAVKTAELGEFIDSLPDGINTLITERGNNLSGGQKQRLTLARALALNPKILLLDDFTARLDLDTERRILENVRNNYPDVTLISVTQKIDSIRDYDEIILLMEGEVLDIGVHEDLLQSSPEYAQIYNSQISTSQYELLT